MNQTNLTYEEIVSLIHNFERSSEFNRLHLKYFDLELELEKKGANPRLSNLVSGGGSGNPLREGLQSTKPDDELSPQTSANALVTAPFTAQHSTIDSSQQVGLLSIKSSMVGTFYSSPEPGAEPFVRVGQHVSESTQVCIIEVMKLMSSIEAGVNGTIVEILVKNNDPVEFGQVLFRVKPD
jgi:acetyl-CoA carboxylase biotin carboxyl carrier protein